LRLRKFFEESKKGAEMGITKLIIGLIGIAMALAATGELPSATRYLATLAMESQQSSLSLRAWNNSLTTGGKIKQHKRLN